MEPVRHAVSAGVMVAALAALALSIAGCKEKTPYPSLQSLRQTVSGEQGRGEGGTAGSGDEVVTGPAGPLALVRTAKGTLLISGRPTGENLVFSQYPYHLFAAEDGFVRVVKVKARAPKVNTPKKRSSLAELVLEEYGPDGVRTRSVDLTAGHSAGHAETEGFIKEALEADPDMAGEFYHVEEIKPLGSAGVWSTWMLTVDSYLGGAHPSSVQKLIVVDSDKAAAVTFDGPFEDRDVARELLGDEFDAACVRKNCGTGPLEGRGGEPVWVVLLCAEFGACEGHFSIRKIDEPEALKKERSDRMVLEEGVLSIPNEGTVARGVADFRVSDDGSMAVMEMALGTKDEVQYPWLPARIKGDRNRTREVRFWSTGMKEPAVVSRMADIQSVQFLSNHKHPDEIVAAIKGLAK